jgi:hypothetical protein
MKQFTDEQITALRDKADQLRRGLLGTEGGYLAREIIDILDAEPSPGQASGEAREIIEHCASLAVVYMQDQPSWDGTAADCGYLRDAIVNGDHRALLASRPVPTAEKGLREALEFYAYPEKTKYKGEWQDDYPGGITYQKGDDCYCDTGEIARAALVPREDKP